MKFTGRQGRLHGVGTRADASGVVLKSYGTAVVLTETQLFAGLDCINGK